MHPLLKLIATEPQLLADHAEAYASLVSAEIGSASTAWKRRAVLGAASVACLGLAIGLGGVAIMLWAVTPPAAIQLPWVLIATPGVPLFAALACRLAAGAAPSAGAFDALRGQVKADMALLREVRAS